MPRVAGILALPLITRYVTAADYGVAGVVTAYVGALSMLQSLGLSVVMVRSYARYPTRYKYIWRQLQGFLLLWALVYGLLLGAVLYASVPESAAQHRWAIVLLHVIPAAFFSSTQMPAFLYYQMQQRPLPVALRTFAVSLVTVGGNVFTIVYLHMGYMGWFWASFAGALLGFLLYAKALYLNEQMWPIFRFKWERIRHSLRVSLPVIPHQFSFFMLDSSDKLVMDVLRVPVPRIGFYNIASSFGLYFSAASDAVVQAASPFYMQFYAEARAKAGALQARQMTFALQLLFLLGSFLVGLWLREIFLLLISNRELQQAYPLAIIILMGYNYRPMYLAAVNLLVYREQTKVLWKISTVAGVGNIVLNLILVPIYGIQAAAFTTFAALMYMGYAAYLLKEYRRVMQVRYYPVAWLLLTITMLLAVYMLADAALLYKVWLTIAASLLAVGAGCLYRKKLGLG